MKTSLLMILIALVNSFDLMASPSGEEILVKSDEYRGLKKDFSLHMRVKFYKSNELKAEGLSKVYIKDDRRTIGRSFEPESMKGVVILSTEENMWFYIPKARNPIRVPSQQRYLGHASMGDMARITYAGDYYAEIASIVQMENKECYFLKLTSKSPLAAYSKIDFYVEKGSYKPVKSIFYAKTGKVLKESTYQYAQNKKGIYYINQQIFTDKIQVKEKTILEYSNIKAESLPEAYFQKNFMERIK